jgi:rod shape-determining protein MreC
VKKALRLLVAVFVIFFLIYLTYIPKRQGKQKAFVLDRAVVSVYQHVVEVYGESTRAMGNLVDKYFFLVGKHDENLKLNETVNLLKIQNQALRTDLGEKQQDEKAEIKYKYMNREVVRANILGFDPFSQSRTIMIKGGKDHAFQPNSVVVTMDGLVGRIIEVFNRSSKVLLVIDNYFSVDALNQRTNMRCLVKGLSLNRLEANRFAFLSQVEFLQLGQELRNGDELVTSGLAGIYPPGIFVGRILRTEYSRDGYFEKSLVLPGVDFTKLKEVYVLKETE